MNFNKINNYFADLPAACWMHLFLIVLNSISIGVCFFLSLYFNQKGFLVFDIGLLMASYGLGTVLGGYLIGKLCDIYEPTRLLKLCILFQSLSFLSLYYVHSEANIIFILFMLGLSSYGFKTSNAVKMLKYCETMEVRNKAMNLSYAISNLGLGISGAFIGCLSVTNFRLIFPVASGVLILSLLFLILLKFNKPIEIKFNSKSDSTEYEISQKYFILALISLFFVGIIIAQLSSTYPIYIKDSFPALGMKAVSILFILDTVLIVLFQVPLSNFFTENKLVVMGMGAFLMGSGMLSLSMSTSFIAAIFSCCLWTIGEMLFIPSVQLIVYENTNHVKKGSGMGYFQSTYAASTVIGPMIGGYIYTVMGKNSIWYFSFTIGLVCLLSCLMLKNKQQSTPAALAA